MIAKVLANRWVAAADLARDKNLNKAQVTQDTAERMLKEEHLDAFRPRIVPFPLLRK